MIRRAWIILKRAACVWAAFFIAIVNAHGSDPPISIVTLSAAADSEDGRDYYLDANIALADQRRFIVSVGRLYIKSEESGKTIEPVTALAGLETEHDAKMPLGIEFEYWDDQESVDVKTLRGKLGYRFERAGVTFIPQIREFNFEGQWATREFSSEGFVLNLGVEPLDSVYVYGEYGKHYYSQRLIAIAPFLLPYETLRLKLVNSVGFSDTIYQLGGNLYLNWGILGGYWMRSVSAIDQAKTYSYGGTVEIDVFQDLSLGLSSGAQTFERDDTDFYFGAVSLSHYW